MNKIIKKEEVVIENMIYEVRGIQVMLSSDVAKLYQVETKRINEVIKRNINRFPESFCFQLTNEEIDELSSRSQFATLNKSNNLRGYNVKYLPYVLTEQGIMMLSGLLKSDIAVKVNIQIIDAFVKMRRYFANTLNNKILINEELDKSMKKIYFISTAYPEVLNNLKYVKYEKELIRCGKRIVKCRKKYNNAVKLCENRKKIFPTNLIAWIFRDVNYKYYRLNDEE